MSDQLLSHEEALDEILKAEKSADYDEKMKKMKGKGEGKDDDEEEEEEEEEGKGKAAKGDMTAADLMKSLDILTGTATMFAGTPPTRQAELAAKIANGDQLSKAEASELSGLLAFGEGEAGFEKSSRDVLLEDQNITDALEISDFLESFVTKSGLIMDSQREILTKSIQEQRQVNLSLAKALQAQGSLLVNQNVLIKGMAERLGAYEDAPVAPKGKTRPTQVGRPFAEAGGEAGATAEAIAKAQGGGTPEGDLSPGGLMTDLESMIAKSFAQGQDGVLNGNDLNFALIKCESSGVVDRTTLTQIQAHRAAARA